MEKTAILDKNTIGIKKIPKTAKSFKRRAAEFVVAAVVFSVLFVGGYDHLGGSPCMKNIIRTGSGDLLGKPAAVDVCPVHPKLVPVDQFYGIERFRTPEYRDHSVAVWSGAVKIDTQSYDDKGPVGVDPRWDNFYKFDKYLKQTFPLIYDRFQVEYVNTHGLVFTLAGSDPSLKPLMLTAHQDVVPVSAETISRWTYPPFSGHYDGTYVWGRGSADCKNDLIGILEALSALLEQDYKPTRTILLAFGFDEETVGFEGAGHIGPFLEQRYGKDSIFAIVDEGNGISVVNGTVFALPATAEKSYIDTTITLKTTGGHSSMPPEHTGIGILSLLIALLEGKSWPATLTPKNPYYQGLQCIASHGADVDPALKKDILSMDTDDAALQRVVDNIITWPLEKHLIRSTKAADIIRGGDKVNALPEEVSVIVNTRGAVESRLDDIKELYKSIAIPIANRFNLELEAYGVEVPLELNGPPAGSLNLTGHGELEPAPSTPVTDNPTWDILGGTANYVFADFLGKNETVYTAPGLCSGNTDTKYYWNLTKNIYRFSPSRETSRVGFHAVDEHVLVDSHLEGVAFYYTLLRNVEQYSKSVSNRTSTL